MSDKDETLSVLFYRDRDAWHEAVGDRLDALIDRVGVLWEERGVLDGVMPDKLDEMTPEQVNAAVRELQREIRTLTTDNAALQATIDRHVADVAALRAKSEGLEKIIKARYGYW